MNRIAIDLSALEDAPYVGSASYARGLLQAFSALPEAARWQWHIIAGKAQDLSSYPAPSGTRVLRLSARRQGRASALISHQWYLPRILAEQQIDVYHAVGLYSVPSLPAPPLGGARLTQRVVTIHDLIPLCHPEINGTGWRGWRKQLFYRHLLRRVTRSAWIITDSRYSARDLLSKTDVPPERLATIALAVDADDSALSAAELPALAPIRRPFILHIGSGQPTKNIPVLLQAYAQLRRDTPEVAPQLVLIGSYPQIRAQIDRFCPAYADDVVLLGGVSRAELSARLRSAAALLFPSTYEGFGLPPLEAMALGCPVVCSNAASLPEVVGDAALLCAAGDVRGFSVALRRVLLEPGLADELRRRGAIQAASFRWRTTALQTLAVYHAALQEARPAPVGSVSVSRHRS